MPYANNKGADQPAHLLLAAPHIRCCRHIKEFLRTKVSLSITFLVSLKFLWAFLWIVGRHSPTKSNAKQTAFNKHARVFTPQLIDNYLSKRIRVVSPTFPFAPESFRPLSLSPRRYVPESFRPLFRSPLSRFAHFPVRPRVVSPPYKTLFLVVLFRSQKWYEALIFLFIGDFT